jgi:hypothetical protein
MAILTDLQIKAKFREIDARLAALEAGGGGGGSVETRLAALEALAATVNTRLDAKDARDLEFQATLDAIREALEDTP